MMLLDGSPSATPIRRTRGFSGTAAAVEAPSTSANSIMTIRNIELSLVRWHFFAGARTDALNGRGGPMFFPGARLGDRAGAGKYCEGLAAIRNTALPRERDRAGRLRLESAGDLPPRLPALPPIQPTATTRGFARGDPPCIAAGDAARDRRRQRRTGVHAGSGAHTGDVRDRTRR